MSIFSDALRILDRNTVQYMVKQKQEQVDRLVAANHHRISCDVVENISFFRK